MRFSKSKDPFPRRFSNWRSTSGNNDHRIVQLKSKGGLLHVITGEKSDLRSEKINADTIFFRPHVFYSNDYHQDMFEILPLRPIGVKHFGEDNSATETFAIDPQEWDVVGVWEDNEFDMSNYKSHAGKQDMKKIFDDWELPHNISQKGMPNLWVWSESSRNRWAGIDIDGTDHAIWIGPNDQRSVKQMLSNLNTAQAAINYKLILT